MSWTLDQIEAEALKLPEESRAKLVERLLLSFDEAEMDREVEQSWLEEAERRDREMTESGDPGIPAAEVFRRLRSSLG